MTDNTSYSDIAGWYDRRLQTDPLFHDVLLPALLQLVGPVEGQRVCDIACGQGWVARELARRGARVTGLDISQELLAIARRYEKREHLGIRYRHTDAQHGKRVRSHSFDGGVCVMALMNIPDLKATLQTIRRILMPGGWLVLVITHPCFEAPEARWWSPSDEGGPYRAVRGYFSEGYWLASSGGVTSLVGQYHRTLSTYLNALEEAGFTFERMDEPIGTGTHAQQVPGSLQVPRLALIRVRAE